MKHSLHTTGPCPQESRQVSEYPVPDTKLLLGRDRRPAKAHWSGGCTLIVTSRAGEKHRGRTQGCLESNLGLLLIAYVLKHPLSLTLLPHVRQATQRIKRVNPSGALRTAPSRMLHHCCDCHHFLLDANPSSLLHPFGHGLELGRCHVLLHFPQSKIMNKYLPGALGFS